MKTRRVIIAWVVVTFLAAVLGALFAGLAGLLYSKGELTLSAAGDLIHYGARIGLGAAIAAAIVPAAAVLWHRRATIILPALLALAIGGAAFGWPYAIHLHAQSVPPIHDISTDTAHPPQFVVLAPIRRAAPNGLEYGGGGPAMARAEEQGLARFFSSPPGRAYPRYTRVAAICKRWGPTCLAAVQRAYYPSIRPLIAPGVAPARAFSAALASARSMGWTVLAGNQKTGHIEATATTTWFHFKDDIAIEVSPAKDGSIINIRSESRLGLSDLGRNAAHVRSYLKRLAHKLLQES